MERSRIEWILPFFLGNIEKMSPLSGQEKYRKTKKNQPNKHITNVDNKTLQTSRSTVVLCISILSFPSISGHQNKLFSKLIELCLLFFWLPGLWQCHRNSVIRNTLCAPWVSCFPGSTHLFLGILPSNYYRPVTRPFSPQFWLISFIFQLPSLNGLKICLISIDFVLCPHWTRRNLTNKSAFRKCNQFENQQHWLNPIAFALCHWMKLIIITVNYLAIYSSLK